ncbi:MAG: polysaccharide pyruvyl transferase CsaB [Firmicutes bacterium]|nr:polysaccharide pyruvyl transferase CsaB [Bacillota bacterium]
MRILVSGYYGFRNAGDEAILAGMIHAIREREPEAVFTVISGRAEETRRVHGVEAISRNRIRAAWAAVGQADLVLSGGGSLLQDVTSTKSIPYYLGVVAMALLRRKPVMFYAQGVGPIRGVLGKVLVRLVANRVARITVRDPESAELLRRLGVTRPPVAVTADAALALPPGDREAGRRLLTAAGVPASRTLIGVSVRPWKEWEERAQKGLAQALDRLAAELNAHVVFLPMQPTADPGAAEAVARQMTAPATVVRGEDWTYRETLDAVAACDLLIGMRYHALVFAAMAGVPLVGLSYDPKIDAFLRQLGTAPAGSTRHLDPDTLVAAARAAWETREETRARMARILAILRERSRENARLAVELTERRRSQ